MVLRARYTVDGKHLTGKVQIPEGLKGQEAADAAKVVFEATHSKAKSVEVLYLASAAGVVFDGTPKPEAESKEPEAPKDEKAPAPRQTAGNQARNQPRNQAGK